MTHENQDDAFVLVIAGDCNHRVRRGAFPGGRRDPITIQNISYPREIEAVIRTKERPKELRKEIEEGEMPPFLYTLAHPAARLGDEELGRLVEGLIVTAAQGGTVRR